MSTKQHKKITTTKVPMSKPKKARRQARSAVAIETASTSVLANNKSLIIKSLLGKSA